MRTRVIRSLLALAVAVGAAVVGFATPASGGGWAVGSLDSVPVPAPGATVEVGFTVLQHGVTPVDAADFTALEGHHGFGLEVVHADGTTSFFEAEPGDRPGHFIASVTFPATVGDYEWTIQMGPFGPFDVGTVTVASPDDTGGSSVWAWARWVVLGLAVALASVAGIDAATHRRPRPIPTS